MKMKSVLNLKRGPLFKCFMLSDELVNDALYEEIIRYFMARFSQSLNRSAVDDIQPLLSNCSHIV